jgi:hypothetical protein
MPTFWNLAWVLKYAMLEDLSPEDFLLDDGVRRPKHQAWLPHDLDCSTLKILLMLYPLRRSESVRYI